MNLATFWTTPRWYAYEHACGHPIGQRNSLLGSGKFQTRVVDLRQSRDELWAGVRRSYHALINRMLRLYPLTGGPCNTLVVVGAGGGGLIRTVQRLHMIESGRRTRSDESWNLMGDWLDDGLALMTVAENINYVQTIPAAVAHETIAGLPISAGHWPQHDVGFTYFIVDGKWSYYASAATVHRDINHLLVWTAMLALKARGVQWCELGWQGEAVDDKGKAIEFFRRGFGGKDVSLHAELPRDW